MVMQVQVSEQNHGTELFKLLSPEYNINKPAMWTGEQNRKQEGGPFVYIGVSYVLIGSDHGSSYALSVFISAKVWLPTIQVYNVKNKLNTLHISANVYCSIRLCIAQYLS